MNANRKVAGGGVLVLAVLSCFVGCSSSYNSSGETAAMHSAASSGSGAPAASAATPASASLMSQLGGLSGVNALADAFGANLAGNPQLSHVLDAGAISQTKMGLVNEVAKASGTPAPNPGADMLSALSGKGLNADQVGAVTTALSSAADQMHLEAPQKTAVMNLLAPVTNKLHG